MENDDLIGQRFGRLTVVDRAGFHKTKTGGYALWRCRCECGNEKLARGAHLRVGHTTSCGCGRRKHGHSKIGWKSPTYSSWQAMIGRCTLPSSFGYEHYKSRGITICERWRTFENFLADMGERPSKRVTIERINNSGNYEPGNCRWATRREQGNNRSTNVRFTYRGMGYTLAELARHTGVAKEVLRSRLIRTTGWTVEGAVHTPVSARGHWREVVKS